MMSFYLIYKLKIKGVSNIMLTVFQFKSLYPNCIDAEKWIESMNHLFPQYEINTINRIASFISQCGHESGGWRVFVENLNYSTEALDRIFGKYFKMSGRNAINYARRPELIANIVYANRMGNGGIDSGDGWRYRGRGPIQLTGKSNYYTFSNFSGIDVVGDPNIVQYDISTSLLSAIWFWVTNNLNRYADIGDIKMMTKRINGGYNGLEDRINHYNAIMREISISEIGILKKGSTGEGVKLLQSSLGIVTDGDFGFETEKTLKRWQLSKGLVADGVAGPNTLRILLNT